MSVGFRGGAGLGWILGRLKLDGGTVSRSLPVLSLRQVWAASQQFFSAVRFELTDYGSRNEPYFNQQIGVQSTVFSYFRNGLHLSGLQQNGTYYAPSFIVDAVNDSSGYPYSGAGSSVMGRGFFVRSNGVNGYGRIGQADGLICSGSMTLTNFPILGRANSPAGLAILNGCLGFSTSAGYATADILLWRDAAATLALRDGTNGQTTRTYRTFADASNYERVSLNLSSNTFTFGPEAAGTGTLRPLYLRTATTTVANLAAAATVGAGTICHVTDATATTPRSTAAGGGSNFVQVMSDGTNWLIVA